MASDTPQPLNACALCGKALRTRDDAYWVDEEWQINLGIAVPAVICAACYAIADWGQCPQGAHEHPRGLDTRCDAQSHVVARGQPHALTTLFHQA